MAHPPCAVPRPARRPWSAALASALLSLTLATPAGASDQEAEGRGFRVRLPEGFRPAGMRREGEFEEQVFKRRLEREGTLTLTIASRTEDTQDEARLEMELAAGLDQVEAALDLGGAQTQGHPVRVQGAAEAHEAIAVGGASRQHLLTARQARLMVHVSLEGPGEAEEEAAAAWNTVLSSLTLVEPGTSPLVYVLVALGLLAGSALALTVRRLRRRDAGPASPPDALAARRRGAASPAEVTPFTPQPLPQAPVLGRAQGGGLSRADDGLPVFDADAKAKGLADAAPLRPPAPPPKAFVRPAAAPAPAAPRSANLVPPPLKVRTGVPSQS